MKTKNVFNVTRVRGVALVAAWSIVAAFALPAGAQTLTYDVGQNLGWFAANAWLDGDNEAANWSSGASAVIESTSTGQTNSIIIAYSDSTAVDSLELRNNIALDTGSAAALHLMTFNGGTIYAAGGGTGVTNAATLRGIRVVGNFTKTGSGLLIYDGYFNGAAQFEGTLTVNEGSVRITRITDTMRTQSNIVVNDGAEVTLQHSPHVDGIGHMTVNTGGELNIGRSADESYTLTLTGLSGTGGTLKVRGQIHGTEPANWDTDRVKTLRINQSTDTVFNGSIAGVFLSPNKDLPGPRYADSLFELIHQGSGTLTLGGNIHLERQTQVTAGRLNINSTNTQFANREGAVAIYANGGTLGGTGTITVTDDSNVALSATGKLAAGIAGEAGRTTYALGTGILDLNDATAGANAGWLLFDLGSATTAGTTYDQVRLTSGTLDIGDGLSFSDFDFTLLAGFGPGTYVLFETPGEIFGSLGAVTDNLNDYESTLSISGNNLILTVIPEPGSIALLLAGAALVAIARRKQRCGRG